jgi:alpha-tubulin N-acetyltransferase 1
MANGHVTYIKAEGNRCIGFIKVGEKKLFVRGRSGEINEIKPLAVLDFFVDPTVQRGGQGRKLFDAMLSD